MKIVFQTLDNKHQCRALVSEIGKTKTVSYYHAVYSLEKSSRASCRGRKPHKARALPTARSREGASEAKTSMICRARTREQGES